MEVLSIIGIFCLGAIVLVGCFIAGIIFVVKVMQKLCGKVFSSGTKKKSKK